MTTRARYGEPWFDLYAENARPAGGPDSQKQMHPADLTSRCALCRDPARPGERVADLTGGRGLVHVPCLSWNVQQLGGRH